MINILIIEGTNRDDRESIKVARFIESVAKKRDDMEVKLVDPLDFDLAKEQSAPNEYAEAVKWADGFVVVMPEYNHGFPGTLKTLMDTQLKEYIHKPVLMAGVSAGPWGGVRAIQSFLPVGREYGMILTFEDLYFPFVGKLFDEEGNITEDKFVDRVTRGLDELLWNARTLKWGRENIENKHHGTK